MVEDVYEYPYSIYQKYFPDGNEDEFNEAFVSFDVSEEEFHILTDNTIGKFVCWETVVFDLNKIKTPINKNILNQFGYFLDIDDTEKAYELANLKINWIDYSIGNNSWDEDEYYKNFNKWWDNLSLDKKKEIYYKLKKNQYRKG